jgi:RNA polymerase sigma factor (sigma-70 family)
MSDLSQAERYLIEQIRAGSQDGWSQLVQRYQGRLLAYARGQLRAPADAEDMVQETFLGFLKGLDRFQTRASLETYLFTILRRRIVDALRRRGRAGGLGVCSLQDSLAPAGAGSARSLDDRLPGSDPSASWYVERGEELALQQDVLWRALRASVRRLQRDLRFRDLQIFEMVFYAQLRNKDIAARLDMDEKQIALIKHRFVQRIAEQVSHTEIGSELLTDHNLLTRMWEQHRPSCPKRSTVGKFVLGTLDDAWRDYVAYHVETLGCRFCQANLADFQDQTADEPTTSFCHRIMQSSVGFFRTA